MDNLTVIAGNLTDAPELRFTSNGVEVCSFSVAVNHRRPDGQGGWTDDGATFFRCVAWRDLAVNLAESLGKGDRIIAAGRIRQRSWETPEGETRTTLELTVDEAGPSLRWAQAKPRKLDRRHREPAAAAAATAPGGAFADEPPF